MKRTFFLALIAATLFSACEVSTSSSTVVEGETVSSDNAGGLTGAVVKNGIEIEATGVKVAEAYLMTDDRQYKDGNTVAVNEKVILTVKADTGWTKHNGKSFIGISERITDDQGNVILDGEDLFKDYDAEGVDATAAQLLNATAVITQKSTVGNNDFTVSFKMWDKKGTGVIKGSYKLHVD